MQFLFCVTYGLTCVWFWVRYKKRHCGFFCVFVFQVTYIYTLALFEDYLYAIHSDPSKGSSTVELLQVHRFNITADSKTLASLGDSTSLRVYHKLSQPKGKGHFLRINTRVLTFLILLPNYSL